MHFPIVTETAFHRTSLIYHNYNNQRNSLIVAKSSMVGFDNACSGVLSTYIAYSPIETLIVRNNANNYEERTRSMNNEH